MKYFTVDILTPSKIVAKNVSAESLFIPTIRGQINVLENHTHVISKLSTGVLSLFGGIDYTDRHFSISDGVCKILDNKVIIMANTTEESHEINLERAKSSLKHNEELLKNTEGLSLEEIDGLHQACERAKLRIQLATK